MATVQSSNDEEPFIPPACMTPAVLTTGPGSVEQLTTRHDADVADEEVVVATAGVHSDNDELMAEKAAEKMIERRIQVCIN